MKKYRVLLMLKLDQEAVDGVDAIHRAKANLGHLEQGAVLNVQREGFQNSDIPAVIHTDPKCIECFLMAL